MKILLYTDVHFSQYSSIIRTRGVKYSSRLENIIESLNWAENLSKIKNCDAVVCLGDFFDRAELNCEEITALQDIIWNDNINHYFIVGNHESNINNLIYSSTNCLNKDNFSIINNHEQYILDESDTALCFIPYVIEDNRKPIEEYLPKQFRKKIIFSHNDIKGIRYGKFESKQGFSIDEIEANCDLFINGHLHNGTFLNDKETILNLGNLTGQNFSEDAFNYPHFTCVLDTNTLELEFYENPFAYNFYRIEIDNHTDIKKLYTLKNNSVVSLHCANSLVETVKTVISDLKNVNHYRIISHADASNIGETSELATLNSSDYLNQFYNFITDKLGSTELIMEELSQIIGG